MPGYGAGEATRQSVMLVIASGQSLPNLLPLGPRMRLRARQYRIVIHEREAIAVLEQRIAIWMTLRMEDDAVRPLADNDTRCAVRDRGLSIPRNGGRH